MRRAEVCLQFYKHTTTTGGNYEGEVGNDLSSNLLTQPFRLFLGGPGGPWGVLSKGLTQSLDWHWRALPLAGVWSWGSGEGLEALFFGLTRGGSSLPCSGGVKHGVKLQGTHSL